MKNTIIKIIYLFSLAMLCLNMSGCNKTEPQPMLKVITSDQIGVTIFSHDRYFIVYDNGKTETTSQFTSSNMDYYSFSSDDSISAISNVDLNTEEGAKINEIGEKIILSSEKEDAIVRLKRMYLINDKYYFTVLLKKGWFFTYNALYEYTEADECIQRIGTFKGSIIQVESYQNSD